MLAVVVLNWNGGDDTLSCLKSVFLSDLPGLRVYVADNGSTDGSLARVRAAYPDARILENGANLGYAGGNNRGWQAAAAEGADRILFLNNDAVVAPDAIRLLAEALDADANVAAVSPRIFRGSGPEDGTGDVWFEKGAVTLDSFLVSDHVPAGSAERTASSYDTDCACGCALLIGVESLRATGGFDEGFFAYYEDVDLSLKLQKRGKRCAVVPGARAWHKVSASTGGGLSPLVAFYLFRNGWYLARRHASAAGRQHYRRGFFRELLRNAAWLSRADPAVGVAVLQGGVCALLGQQGVRPAYLPAAPFRGIIALTRFFLRSNASLPLARS